MARRLLLISYVFPPAPSPGAQRPGYLARYLPNYDWAVTVLTRSAGLPPFECSIATTHSGVPVQSRIRGFLDANGQTPDSSLRYAMRAVKDATLFPDTAMPWIPRAVTTGLKLLRERQYDAIFSTALPASAHVVGAFLAQSSGLPWIADYRDPWAGNDYVKRRGFRRSLEEALERFLLRRADAVTTISQSIAEKLSIFHSRKDVDVIPNAYDPDEWLSIPKVKPSQFNLVYTGSMYDGKRSPELLFSALSKLRDRGEQAATDAHIHFYGPNSGNVGVEARQSGVHAHVHQYGIVERLEAMKAQRSAAALLIFLNMDPSTSHEMGSKVLEYIGAQRPIIAFGPPQSRMRGFLEDHGLGWFASNVEEAKDALRLAHQSFVSGAHDISIRNGVALTANDLALRFGQRLDSVVNARSAPMKHWQLSGQGEYRP